MIAANGHVPGDGRGYGLGQGGGGGYGHGYGNGYGEGRSGSALDDGISDDGCGGGDGTHGPLVAVTP